jgi:multidrug efflux pump subunit AcrA (membrane-fusion protein)
VAANEGRALVGCDRVSVLIQRGRKISVVAVSGQESIHPRSNLIRSMVNLSREVIKSGLPLKYTGSMDSFSPQVEERLADFVQESGARLVFAVPLRESAPLEFTPPANHRPLPPGRVFGCLLLEQFSQSDPSAELVKQLDWLTAYSSASLHSARTHQALFLMPVWRLLGKATEWLHGRKLIKTSIAFTVIAALVAAMVLIRVDFRIEGEGRLMPVVKREIFVPLDSEVLEVLVASGQRVTAGQLLVRLRSNELRTDLIAAQSQFQEKQKLLAALLAERDEAIRGQLSERTYRIEGDLAKTRVELQGLELQLSVLEERDNLLKVTSPITGVVSTFDVDQLLRHRPVRRGEILLEVMDETGPWQLELEVPEQRMGHLLSAKQAAENPLPIEFLLVTSPERTYEGTLKEVATRSIISPDGTPVVEIQANLPDEQELTRRIGAEVRAKVQCGRSSLGYVLFGDVVEFFQRNLWL